MDRRFAFVLTTTRSFGVCLIASHPSAKNTERMGHPSLGLIYISLMNGWATRPGWSGSIPAALQLVVVFGIEVDRPECLEDAKLLPTLHGSGGGKRGLLGLVVSGESAIGCHVWIVTHFICNDEGRLRRKLPHVRPSAP
jgi:hypothetical protein